jgi:hypothetical protein
MQDLSHIFEKKHLNRRVPAETGAEHIQMPKLRIQTERLTTQE